MIYSKRGANTIFMIFNLLDVLFKKMDKTRREELYSAGWCFTQKEGQAQVEPNLSQLEANLAQLGLKFAQVSQLEPSLNQLGASLSQARGSKAEMRRKKKKNSTSQPWSGQGQDPPVSFETSTYPGENSGPAHLSLGLAKVKIRRI